MNYLYHKVLSTTTYLQSLFRSCEAHSVHIDLYVYVLIDTRTRSHIVANIIYYKLLLYNSIILIDFSPAAKQQN